MHGEMGKEDGGGRERGGGGVWLTGETGWFLVECTPWELLHHLYIHAYSLHSSDVI